MHRRLRLAVSLACVLALGACSQLFAEQPDLPHYYLKQALVAVQAHDSTTALANIAKAEQLWIGGNIPYQNPIIEFDPDAMREMARARQSVQMQRWGDAEYYVRTAMRHPSTVSPP